TCIAYFSLIDAITLLVLGIGVVVSGDALPIATLLAPPYLAAAAIGARVFGGSGGQRYRPPSPSSLLAALGAFGRARRPAPTTVLARGRPRCRRHGTIGGDRR